MAATIFIGIEIRMQWCPYRVRGKAFDLDGKPVRAGRITSFSQDDLTVAASVFSGKTGVGYFTLSRSTMPSAADQEGGIVPRRRFSSLPHPCLGGCARFRVTQMSVDPDHLKEELWNRLKEQLEQMKRKRGRTGVSPKPSHSLPLHLL